MSSIITAEENGNVTVFRDYYDWTDGCNVRVEERYTSVGSYVHRVFSNGATVQVCEGLSATGPTLMLSGTLEETIRKTLALK